MNSSGRMGRGPKPGRRDCRRCSCRAARRLVSHRIFPASAIKSTQSLRRAPKANANAAAAAPLHIALRGKRTGLQFAACRRVSLSKPARILVVFFSRTGNTRKVAEALAHAASADIEELREARSRRGLLGYVRSAYEATRALASGELLPSTYDPAGYDIVFIGSPTWSASLSSPVRAYLEQKRASLSDVGLFVTSGGGVTDGVLAQMSGLLMKPPLAKLALREADVKRSPAAQVGEFLEAALVAWERKLGSKSPAVLRSSTWHY